MNRFSPHISSILCVFAFLLVLNCSKPLETETFPDSSLISVKLYGTPTQLSKFNLDVIGVQLRVLEDSGAEDAWISLETTNFGVFDVTDIDHTQLITLVDFEEVPVHYIYEIRLVLGEDNSIVMNGLNYDVSIPQEFHDASHNVVKKQLEANVLYDFLIEFDVDASVRIMSNGQAELHPEMNTLLRQFQLF